MLRVNSVNNIGCKKPNYQSRPAFTGENQNQVTSLPEVCADYNVKVPMSYNKMGVLNLPNDFKAHYYKLANGQQVIIVPKSEGETVVKTYVNTGSMNEPDNVRGISHYIEHNLFNGSEGLEAGEFFKTVDKMGAKTNASTGLAHTDYFVSSNLLNDGDLEKKIKIHASMLESPKFALNMLEKEKGIVNSEINMYQGHADCIASNLTLKNLFNIKSSSPDLIAGTTTNINNITKQDVLDYYNNNYYPANMVTVITGEVEPDETIKLVSKYFSGKNKISHARKFETLTPIEKTVRQDVYSDKTNATLTIVGFSGPQSNDVKSRLCVSALCQMLNNYKSGRLDKALKQYNTFPQIDIEKVSCRPQDPRAILIEAETDEKNCENVLQEVFNQIYSISASPDFDDELKAVKKNMILKNNSRYEKSSRLNNMIGTSVLNGNFDYVTDYENLVNSITKEDIINAAQKYLDLNKAAITVVHPKKDVSFTGSVEKRAINPENVQRYRMNNNFEVALNNSNNDVSVLNFEFNTNSIPDANPVARILLGEILREGSLYRTADEFGEDMHKNAIDTEFYNDANSIHAEIKCSSVDTEKAFQALTEVLYSPRFDEKTFEFVRNKYIDELSRMDKSVRDLLDKELFDGQPLGYTPDELLDYAQKVTLDDVKTLYSQIVSNAEGSVTVSAPFKRNPQLKNVVFNSVGNLPTVKPFTAFVLDTYKPTTETKVLIDTDTKEQADIIEAFKFRMDGNMKDTVTVGLLNTILGGNSSSRLFNDLREKQQLAYHVSSNVYYSHNTGVMELKIGTTTENSEQNKTSYDNVQKSIDGFNKHINKLMTEKVSQEELDNAKLYLKNSILSLNETVKGKTMSIHSGMNGFYGTLEENEILKMIDSITVDDIYNAAHYIFSNKPVYSILATENTVNANLDYFKSL